MESKDLHQQPLLQLNMDKKAALKILIQHSFLLTEVTKAQLVNKIPGMTEEQMDILGKLLAEEKKQSLIANPEKIKSLEPVIEKLTKLSNGS